MQSGFRALAFQGFRLGTTKELFALTDFLPMKNLCWIRRHPWIESLLHAGRYYLVGELFKARIAAQRVKERLDFAQALVVSSTGRRYLRTTG